MIQPCTCVVRPAYAPSSRSRMLSVLLLCGAPAAANFARSSPRSTCHVGHQHWAAAESPPRGSYDASVFGLQAHFWTPFWTHRPCGGGGAAQLLDLEDLGRLVQRVRKSNAAGARVSNQGGWQSPGNLLEMPPVAATPVFQALVSEIKRQAREFVHAAAASSATAGVVPPPFDVQLTRIWANVNTFSDFNNPHTHGAAHVSGVFYVDTGGDADAALELLDPRLNLRGSSAAVLADRRRHNRTAAAATVDGGDRPLPAAVWQAGRGRLVPVQPGLVVVFPAWLPHWVHPHAGKRPRVSISFNLNVVPAATAARTPSAADRPTGTNVWVADRKETVREALRALREPGQPLPATAPACRDNGRGLLELAWPTPTRVAELESVAATALRELAERALAKALAAAPPVKKRSKKPARRKVTSWVGEPLETSQLPGDLLRAVYQQLGWTAAELVGVIDAHTPGWRISAELLWARQVVVGGAQRHMLGAAGASGQLCGMLGLAVPEDSGGVAVRLHDPRPDAGVDPPHTGSFFGRISGLLLRNGTMITYPCWAQYDLVMLDRKAPPPPPQDGRTKVVVAYNADSLPHAFLEFAASVEADERPAGDDGWLRVPTMM